MDDMNEMFGIDDLESDDHDVIVNWAIRSSAMLVLVHRAMTLGDNDDEGFSLEERFAITKGIIERVIDGVPEVMHDTVIDVANMSIKKTTEQEDLIAQFRKDIDNL